MTITAAAVKDLAAGLGADLCGIAGVDRFADAPPGFRPVDIHPDARAVIVVAARFPAGTLTAATQVPYTFVRNKMVGKLDNITFALAGSLEKRGALTVPIPSSDPYDYWDEAQTRGMGILSLKHAAVCAGLGVMGKTPSSSTTASATCCGSAPSSSAPPSTPTPSPATGPAPTPAASASTTAPPRPSTASPSSRKNAAPSQTAPPPAAGGCWRATNAAPSAPPSLVSRTNVGRG
jgi:hypothetical protein